MLIRAPLGYNPSSSSVFSLLAKGLLYGIEGKNSSIVSPNSAS